MMRIPFPVCWVRLLALGRVGCSKGGDGSDPRIYAEAVFTSTFQEERGVRERA
jgi:hypothetical protein